MNQNSTVMWKDYLPRLAHISETEKWNKGLDNQYFLNSYLNELYRIVTNFQNNNVLTFSMTQKYACFATNLFMTSSSSDNNMIYALLFRKKSKDVDENATPTINGLKTEYALKGWFTASELEPFGLSALPLPLSFDLFNKPETVLNFQNDMFYPAIQIADPISSIVSEIARLVKIDASMNQLLGHIDDIGSVLTTSVTQALVEVRRNRYRAIPCVDDTNGMSFLIPVTILSVNPFSASFAMVLKMMFLDSNEYVVSSSNTEYIYTGCMNLEAAYIRARLFNTIESQWLVEVREDVVAVAGNSNELSVPMTQPVIAPTFTLHDQAEVSDDEISIYDEVVEEPDEQVSTNDVEVIGIAPEGPENDEEAESSETETDETVSPRGGMPGDLQAIIVKRLGQLRPVSMRNPLADAEIKTARSSKSIQSLKSLKSARNVKHHPVVDTRVVQTETESVSNTPTRKPAKSVPGIRQSGDDIHIEELSAAIHTFQQKRAASPGRLELTSDNLANTRLPSRGRHSTGTSMGPISFNVDKQAMPSSSDLRKSLLAMMNENPVVMDGHSTAITKDASPLMGILKTSEGKSPKPIRSRISFGPSTPGANRVAKDTITSAADGEGIAMSSSYILSDFHDDSPTISVNLFANESKQTDAEVALAPESDPDSGDVNTNEIEEDVRVIATNSSRLDPGTQKIVDTYKDEILDDADIQQAEDSVYFEPESEPAEKTIVDKSAVEETFLPPDENSDFVNTVLTPHPSFTTRAPDFQSLNKNHKAATKAKKFDKVGSSAERVSAPISPLSTPVSTSANHQMVFPVATYAPFQQAPTATSSLSKKWSSISSSFRSSKTTEQTVESSSKDPSPKSKKSSFAAFMSRSKVTLSDTTSSPKSVIVVEPPNQIESTVIASTPSAVINAESRVAAKTCTPDKVHVKPQSDSIPQEVTVSKFGLSNPDNNVDEPATPITASKPGILKRIASKMLPKTPKTGTKVTNIQSAETPTARRSFRLFTPTTPKTTSKLNSARNIPNASVSTVSATDAGPFYSYEDLVQNRIADIDINNKEKYLDDESFVNKFGMSKASFFLLSDAEKDCKKKLKSLHASSSGVLPVKSKVTDSPSTIPMVTRITNLLMRSRGTSSATSSNNLMADNTSTIETESVSITKPAQTSTEASLQFVENPSMINGQSVLPSPHSDIDGNSSPNSRSRSNSRIRGMSVDNGTVGISSRSRSSSRVTGDHSPVRLVGANIAVRSNPLDQPRSRANTASSMSPKHTDGLYSPGMRSLLAALPTEPSPTRPENDAPESSEDSSVSILRLSPARSECDSANAVQSTITSSAPIVPILAISEQSVSLSPRQDISQREAINSLAAAAQLLDKLKMRRKSSPRANPGTPGRASRSGAHSSRIGSSPRDTLTSVRDSDFIPSEASDTPIKIMSIVENNMFSPDFHTARSVPDSPYVDSNGPFYRYDDLVMNTVKEINMAHKEMYLDNSSFTATFGISRSEFAAFPKWKRDLKKREVGLF